MIKLKIIVIILILVSNCVGFEFDSEKSIGMGGTYLLSKPSAVELLSVPTNKIKPNYFSFSSGFSRSFEIDELDKIFLAFSYRHGMISWAVGLNQLGNSDYYSERTVRLTTGLYYSSFTLSMSYSIRIYEFGTAYENLSGHSFGMGLGYAFQRIITAFTIDNINKPKLYEDGITFKPKYNFYAEMLGFGKYSITCRVSMQEEKKPQIGVGQKVDLSSFSSIFWGFSTEPTTYGGGVEIDYKGKSLQYAASIHPVLGLSQTISITVGFDVNKSGNNNE